MILIFLMILRDKDKTRYFDRQVSVKQLIKIG